MSDTDVDSVPLRIVSWNMNHWQRTLEQRTAAWDHLGGLLRPDIALLQETVPPPAIDRARVVYREIGDYRPWGSAVYAPTDPLRLEEVWSVRTPFSRRRFTLANTYPGSVAIARVSVPGIAPLTVVSLYNVREVYAHTTLLRTIADLMPLFDSGDGARVVLAGDMNMSTADGGLNGTRAAGIFGALGSLGLVDVSELALPRWPAVVPACPYGRGDQCRHFPTWRGAQLDYILVSPTIADQVVSLDVGTTEIDAGLSDHAPVILDLALRAAPVARSWDEDEFADEMERRHGQPVGRVVRELVDWAEKKQIALGQSGGRHRLEVRLIAPSVDPEMRWQMELRAGDRRTLGYLISIRADGQVAVQFQWLVPPFASLQDREPVRQAFNAIPGVHIERDRLGGRPTFPVTALVDPGALAACRAILDRIVDETVEAFVNSPTDAGLVDAQIAGQGGMEQP